MRAAPVVAALIVAFAAGMGAEWAIQRPNQVATETPAPEVRQADDSLMLAKQPDPNAKPAHQIPAGAKVEQIVSVTVIPSAEAMPQTDGFDLQDVGSPASAMPCPPVRVDLTLIRQSDQTRRVIASSPDGRVVGGIDVPVDVPDKPRPTKWGAGYEYAAGTWSRTHSVLAQYDLGPVRVGARIGHQVLTLPTGGSVTGIERAVSVVVRW